MSLVTVLFLGFLALLIFSVPIAMAQGLASILGLQMFEPISLESFAKSITVGFDSFPLVAIPLFTFAGDIMGQGGISARLLNGAKIFLGRLTGGLGMVAVVACMIFAAISGTGSATVAAIGLIMLPQMMKMGYGKPYSAALIATAGTIGVIIPPSIPMVLYGVAANVSITSLFTAGIPVGIVIGTVLCVYTYITSKKHGYVGEDKKYTLKECGAIMVDAIPAFLVPVVVLGGIYGGVFTPTEAGAIGCFMGILISCFVYKEVKLKDVIFIGFRSVILCAPVMFLIGVSFGFGRLLTISQAPQMIAEAILALTSNEILLLLLINLLLFAVGTFMDCAPAIIILVPILLPIATAIGVNPVHFGIIMVFNLAIGFITPPFGANLFMAAEISNTKFEVLVKAIIPWILLMVAILMLLTFVPDISLFLPRLMDLPI